MKFKNIFFRLLIISILFISFEQANASSEVLVNVRVLKIFPVNIPKNINAFGSLFAKEKVDISPQISGQIKKVMFQYGETVQEGQPLYQLDDALYQAQLQEVKSDLAFNKMTYQRFLKLAKTGAISKQDLDKVKLDYQDAQSKFNVLSVELAKTEIKAPFSGVIGASQVDVGQYVNVGASLVSLVDKTNLIARFSVSEDDLSQISQNQIVTIQTESAPNRSFQGQVNYVSPSIDPNTRTVMVWANVPNPTNQLAPGLFVHVKLTIGDEKNALLIPQEALIPTVEGNNIFVIENGKAYQKPVMIGQRVGGDVVIQKELKSGDEVVIAGQEKLANGRSVRVVPQ